MSHRVCPWWIGYVLTCPLRRFMHEPAKLLAPYVRDGMTVLEPGPGMGYFTIELARLVGPTGRVVTVDIQPQMVSRLKRRVGKAGLLARVDSRLAAAETLEIGDLAGKVDFTLAFALVHEMPSAQKFFAEVAAASKSGALVLLAEPAGHVKIKDFEAELRCAGEAGFEVLDQPVVSRSHAAVLKRQ